MNDRFKFRIYNKRTEEMLDVRLISYFSTGNICRVEAQNAVGDIKIFDDYKTSIEDIELLQCTGLKDKNGKLIYEGDIGRIFHLSSTGQPRTYTSEVYYYKVRPSFQVKGYGFIDEDDVVEVIGNRYEHKELLNLIFHTNVLKEKIIGSEDNPVELDKNNIYEHFANLAIALKNGNTYGDIVRPYVIVNPYIEAFLLQSPEFISAHNIKDETLRKGSIGRIAGMDVLVSTNLTEVDGKYYVLAGTNDAITFASQLAKIESLRDKDSFSDLVRGSYLYGAKTVQPKALAKMIVKPSK